MNILEKTVKHFGTVMTHKKWVLYYCRKAGITWRGLKHDLSKLSPTEFWGSVKYYQGDRSPIDACKEANGYSKAWLHHRGRNSHHYEYWTDGYDNGGHALKMPFENALEMLCDYLGAGRAYMKDKFTYTAEFEWWKKKAIKPLLMHPHTRNFIFITLANLATLEKLGEDPLRSFNYNELHYIYNNINDEGRFIYA